MPAKLLKQREKPKERADFGTGNGTDEARIAEPTLGPWNGGEVNLYEQAVKEIVALSENDQYAKKVDTGPLSEARGKDTWQLHTQLKVLEEINKSADGNARQIQASLQQLDEHLHQDTRAVSSLVQDGTRELRSAVDEHGTTIERGLDGMPKTLSDVIERAKEDLYQRLVTDLSAKIDDIKDINARLLDKRFNQTEVAFASVRADVEVVKALLTDIIKSRIGRGERQQG